MTTPSHIAIVAKALSIQDAPWHDPWWAWWVIGNAAQQGLAKKDDVCFELHDEIVSQEYKTYLDAHQHVITNSRITFPHSTPYPLDEVLKQFPRRYLTSSVSMAIAMAILQGPKYIGLWGVNCDDSDEYREQRPCIEYMIGRAEGAGIEVVIPTSSPLCKCTTIYGEETNPAKEAMLQRLSELRGRLNIARLQEQQAMNSRISLEAAISEVDFWKSRV